MQQIHTSISIEGMARGTAFFPDRSPECRGGTLSWDEAFAAEKERLGRLAENAADEMKAIFTAHLEMLEDPMLQETVQAHLQEGLGLPQAIDAAADQLAALFHEIDDEYLRARADDIRDVCRGLRRQVEGATPNPFAGMPKDAVIVSEELFPSDTAEMDFSRVRAFVLRRGSRTSHVCIIARSKGIPVLLGIDIDTICAGDPLLIDGAAGELTVWPTQEEEAAFLSRMEQSASETALQLTGPDGNPVRIEGNAGSLEDIPPVLQAGAEGIGLLRTEFIFMESDHLPSEEEQLAIYREAARLCNGKTLTIRTLDIGGDKSLPYLALPVEDNPFLGLRALRYCLRHEEVFKPQLRAILRAGADGAVRIMFPMVTSPEELREAKALLIRCRDELRAEGLPCADTVPAGIMIETPAAVLMAPELAQEAAFFSIGTNDLTQYIMAADRGNPAVAYLNDPMAEAVLRAIGMTVQAAHAAGIPVCICGEMAYHPAARLRLAALGVDSISLSSPKTIGQLTHS